MGNTLFKKQEWYAVGNADDVTSPSLLVYPERIEANIRKMISMAGDISLLRPHVKTHKMPEIVRMQISEGISKFKCATISEAEMAAGCGSKDILLAYQPVGPNMKRFFELKKRFPGSYLSCIADCETVLQLLSENAVANNSETSVWLDINNGMDRTGIRPGDEAERLYRMMLSLPMLKPEGLHVYDGHIHEPDLLLRRKLCDEDFRPVETLVRKLHKYAGNNIKIVAGGTPTFPIHAKRPGVETSPGTVILWDYGYSSSFTDMDFMHAAAILARVISKPCKDTVCIDLGHKAVASEMPQPRIMIPELSDMKVISHNEEHMVIKSDQSADLEPGDILYAIPFHICPTVDRYDMVSVVRSGNVTEEWNVAARKRRISV
ncbi:MAG: D-TA family PLP-dependent enzyme [Bacteroidales bacterium]|jgi:D-serine deaminase-like pyridoxal phosphate-dependent protein|nr:D-TA family PLP-dependent enzyme [Bacteroidales bacterium]